MDEVYGLKYNQIEDLVEKVKANKGNLSGEGLPLDVTPDKEGQFYLDTLVNELWVAKDQGGSLTWVSPTSGKTVEGTLTGSYVVYGHYYNNFEITFSENGADNCEILEINTAKLQEFLAKQKTDEEWGSSDINFDYQEGYDPQTGEPTGEYMWMYRSMMGEIAIHPDDMYETTGIQVELIDPEAGWAYFSLYEKIAVDTESTDYFSVPTEAYLKTFAFSSENSIGKAYKTQTGEILDVPAVTILSASVQNVEQTPDNFLAYCTSLSSDEQVYFANVEKIGDSTLASTSTNFRLQLAGVKEIGGMFLAANPAFNPRQQADAWSQTLRLHGVEKIGTNFMMGCSSFNSTIEIPDLVEIGASFLQNCSNFNQPLDLKSVRKVEEGFLHQCSQFNQPLEFDSSTRLCLDNLLYMASSFDQDITLPRNSYSVNGEPWIMPFTDSMTGVVDLGDLPAFSMTNNNSSFSANSTSVPAYTTGITLKGKYVNDWIASLPNRANYPYRNLINGGPSPSSGGTTYTFANTSTGWTASGSDGSSFTHTDLGDTITVDSALDTTSENPVQNKVIAGKVNSIESDITDIQGDIGDIESILQTINSGDLTEES